MTVSRKKKVWGQIGEELKKKSVNFPTFCIVYLEDTAVLLLPKFLLLTNIENTPRGSSSMRLITDMNRKE